MEAVALSGRFTLALLFLAAGLAKLRDTGGFADAVAGYRLLPSGWSRPVARWLPVLEVACGAALAAGLLLRPVAIGVAGLLAVFTGAVVRNLVNGRRVACACFGTSTTSPADGWTVARNGGLVVAALVVAAHPPATLAIGAAPSATAALSAADGLAVLVCTTSLLLTAVLATQTFTQTRQPGRGGDR